MKNAYEIQIAPQPQKDDRYVAKYQSGFLSATYSVEFANSITGAVALYHFVEMLRTRYPGGQVTFVLAPRRSDFAYTYVREHSPESNNDQTKSISEDYDLNGLTSGLRLSTTAQSNNGHQMSALLPPTTPRPARASPGCGVRPAREEARTRSGTPQGPQRGAGERQ